MKHNIYHLISNYIPYNEQEEVDKNYMLNFIQTFDDVLTRNNIYGHFTASAFVVNEDFTKTLLVKHNIFGGYIYPGGHADGETDFKQVAIREVFEETGVNAVPYFDEIFAIQSEGVHGHIKKGKYVNSHTHHDILYLLVVKNEDMDKIKIEKSENSDVVWRDLNDCYGNDVVNWAQNINKKIVDKLISLNLAK